MHDINDVFKAPDTLPNTALLRRTAGNRMGSELDTPLDDKQRVLFVELIRSQAALMSEPVNETVMLADMLLARLDEVGKFSGLVALLDANAMYLSKYPRYIIRVSLYLLDFTLERENQDFDWVYLKRTYPDLFAEE